MNCLLNETKPSLDSAIVVATTTTSNNSNKLNINNSNQNNNNNSNNNSSSNHISNNSSQEPCLICGDVASGKHYGLRSCEACKAFFKRTVQGKIEYQCPASRECEINKRRRKACQACRFQKCLNMGMLKEGVRLDRVRGGRQKYRRGLSPLPVNNWNSSVPSTSSGGDGSAGGGIGASSGGGCGSGLDSKGGLLSGAYVSKQQGSTSSNNNNQESSSLSETNKIMTALINCEPEELTVSPAQFVTNIPSTASVQVKTLHILSDLFDRELVSLIGWAKQIPGFSETITLNDQMRLLQSTWAEVIALSIGYRSHLRQQQHHQQSVINTTPSPTSSSPASTASSYNHTSTTHNNNHHPHHLHHHQASNGGGGSGSGSGSSCSSSSSSPLSYNLVFAKDLMIDFKLANVCGAEDIYYNCVQLIKRLDHLKITLKEYILLKAISLTNADVRLENPKATQQLRDLVMETLHEATPSDTVVNHRLNEILLCLPILRQIDSCIRKFWNDVRRGPLSVPMNKLFEEMLEPCQKIYR